MGRSRFAGTLLLAGWALGVLACLRWAFEGASAARLAIASAACLAAGAWAAWSWWRQPPGQLAWDGGAWTWSPAGAPALAGSLEVALDLQGWVLLRWRGEGEAGWLWVERRSAPARWDALRRAVYSRAGSGTPSGAQPPSARP